MTATNWVMSENRRRGKADSFASEGYALPEYTDRGPGKETVSLEIPKAHLSWLSGTFGFGVHPHCASTNGEIALIIETAPIAPNGVVPVPRGVLLGGLGPVLVANLRRRTV